MSSVEENKVILNYQNRKVRFNKEDYKENKKEEFLFNYLNKNTDFGRFLELIDKDKTDNTKEITLKDIEMFCSDKKLQKKGITTEDVINFLNKTKTLNPTELERTYSELYTSFKDENGANIVKEEFEAIFGLKSNYNNRVQFTDKNKKVKPGFELFDLNNDGILDKHEEKFLEENHIYSWSTVKDLKNYLTKLDEAGSADKITDGVITKADKQNLYNTLIEKYNNEQHKLLNNSEIKDDKKQQVVTDAIKNLYKNTMEITFDDLLDENGNLKPGCEIFDLNGDGKLNEIEKSYWANGGHLNLNSKNTIKIEDFLATINELDKIPYDKMYCSNKKDGTILQIDKQRIYNILEGAKFLLDNITDLPENLQNKYKQALSHTSLYDCKSKYAVGLSNSDKTSISINTDSISPLESASIIIHELTHQLLNDSGLDPLYQEVATFFMEYRLSQITRKLPEYNGIVNPGRNKTGIRVRVIDTDYMNYCDKLKKESPSPSNKEIAIEAFLKFKFNEYNGTLFYNKTTPEDIRTVDLSAAEEFFN